MRPYYQDDYATIYHGDCREVLPTLERADLGFADPPYNFGMDYGEGFDDSKDPGEYEEWCLRWFRALEDRVDRMVITPGHGNLKQWLNRKKPAGIGCWYKPGNPAGAGIFQFCEWEPVLVYGKGRIGGSDVWKATTNPSFKGPVGHPCPKPEKLISAVLSATKASSVIDPFLGSGTTLAVAKSMNVHGVGIERNERFCELAAKRLGQEVLDLGGAA